MQYGGYLIFFLETELALLCHKGTTFRCHFFTSLQLPLSQVLPQQDFRIIHRTTQFKECFYARGNFVIFNKRNLIILVY